MAPNGDHLIMSGSFGLIILKKRAGGRLQVVEEKHGARWGRVGEFEGFPEADLWVFSTWRPIWGSGYSVRRTIFAPPECHRARGTPIAAREGYGRELLLYVRLERAARERDRASCLL